MEIGPTTHYIMGGVRVDADTQMSTVPGLFAAGECAAGINGANRLGGNSLSDIIVFGKRAGEHAAKYAAEPGRRRGRRAGGRRRCRATRAGAVRPGHLGRGRLPGAVRAAGHDAGARRHRPERAGDAAALDGLRELRDRAERVGVGGHREYNPGWHAALDLHNLLTVSEAITRCAIERKESRGGHFRDDYPDKDRPSATFNFVVRKGRDGEHGGRRAPIPEMPAELKQIIEEMK